MSDFSLFSLFTAGLALFAPLATAYTQPVGDSPKGNPISQPGLMSIVPAGKPFTVTWEPTTQGSVTLVLLKGPSTDAEPQYAIAEKVPNSGTYVWTPSKDLEPTTDATGYGIQLICDKDGQYQYTTQFGISNPSYDAEDASSSSSSVVSSSSSSVASTSSATSSAASSGYSHGAHGHGGWGHGGHNVHAGYTHSAAWGSSAGTASSTASSLTSSYTHGANGTATGGRAHSTGWATHNVTMVAPTGGSSTSKVKPVHSMSASGYGGSGSSASASTPAGPRATGNGAVAIASSFGGLVLAAGAVVFAL